uniref:Uncharacterized protein n=1 Tax=Anguilla anguilla TaxID=7936 RepID=A0A0E9SKS1_ANGAN
MIRLVINIFPWV